MVSPTDKFVLVRVPDALLEKWEESCDRGDTDMREHAANLVLTYGKRVAEYDDLDTSKPADPTPALLRLTLGAVKRGSDQDLADTHGAAAAIAWLVKRVAFK